MQRDGDEEFVVREDGILLDISVSIDAIESSRQPIGQGEIDGLVEVESVIESRMIRSRESDDEFVRSLIAGDDSNAVFLKSAWTHQRDELEHEIRLLFE